MTVTLRLMETSAPLVFANVVNAYTKGHLYCMRLSDGSTLKFPLCNVFSILETSLSAAEDGA